jgi:dTDP-glucose 4,6-dehydratase
MPANIRRAGADDYACGVKPLPADDLEHALKHTAPLWNSVRNRHVFITGGTGFFGCWLLESFAHCNRELSLGARATVLTRDPRRFLARMPHLAHDAAIQFFAGDVRTFEFPQEPIDFVVHGAAPTSGDAASRPGELLDTIVHGMERIVELANARGAQGFLLVSSGAVYGPQPENISHIGEDFRGGPDWLDPKAAYAEGKRVAEQICAVRARQSGMRSAIARCFAFVGPHLPLNQHFAIGNFIADALAGRKVVIRGDGTPMRSYLYAADLAIWLWTMLLQGADGKRNPTVLNVGSGEAISIRDLAKAVVDELAPGLPIEILGRSDPDKRLEQYVPDVRSAHSCLGLRQTIGLRDAIRRTADWYGQS